MAEQSEEVTQQEVKLWLVLLGVNTPLDSWYLSRRALIKDVYVEFVERNTNICSIKELLSDVCDAINRKTDLCAGLQSIHYDWRGVVFETPDEYMKPKYRDMWNKEAHYGIDSEKAKGRTEDQAKDKKAKEYFDEQQKR